MEAQRDLGSVWGVAGDSIGPAKINTQNKEDIRELPISYSQVTR